MNTQTPLKSMGDFGQGQGRVLVKRIQAALLVELSPG
jgi:hypothetical protein